MASKTCWYNCVRKYRAYYTITQRVLSISILRGNFALCKYQHGKKVYGMALFF